MQTSATGVDEHRWGDAPELYGPRHDFRESLLIRQLADRVQRGHVLNAGCGAGSLTLKLLDRGFEVTSVDASEAFVARLAAELARRGQDGSAEVGDLHSLRFPDGSFDAVVSGEVLEHLADDATAVREFARALRPGGVLAVSVPANPWRYDWTDRWAGHERRYTAEGLRSLLEDAGLTDIAVVPYGFPVTGLYHRHIYRRMLRRRLASDAGRLGGPAGATRRLAPLVRAALQIDTLFLGRFPGYFGLLASARRP
jgi:SAM-dependent methyltransferase